jgi:hypothetical protein
VKTLCHRKVTQSCVTDCVEAADREASARDVVKIVPMRNASLVVLLLAAACSRGSQATNGAAATPAPSALPKSTLAIGAPISAPTVALADIARSPSTYANKTVTTSGRVTAVCQERGCWMEISDASGLAHVRMHGHSFFVPKTASGHLARVQATVLTAPGETCEESPAPAAGAQAKIELDATGVELD